MMFKYLFITIILLLPCWVYSQLQGQIYDENNQALSYVSIYIDGTTNGTTSNESGYYELKLSPGEYIVVYQFVGYASVKEKVVIEEALVEVDVHLSPTKYILEQAEVTATAEDPAYAVIRQAIKKRTYYKDQLSSFSCQSYIKGLYRFIDAPEKVMGFEIGDMGGVLDSTRQGIFYLSESISKYYYNKPQEKEIMISSKVSGNDQGFSFNRAGLTEYNFYENTINIEREMVSPIASYALQYYKYRLDGIFYDEAGRLINKIKVIPKNKVKPIFQGYIFIVEDEWNIHSVDLIATSEALKIPAIDSLGINQIYVPIQDSDKWVILNQVIKIDFSVFGFRGKGGFTGVFSNYELDPEFDEGFFDADLFVAQDSSNRRDEIYWDDSRPIPLTEEEGRDYIKKDSLKEIWNSKIFKDSIDAISNKFKPINVLFGYNYSKSYERFFYEFKSPISTVQYNPIQGYNFDLDFFIWRTKDDYATSEWSINPKLQYGFSDKRLRGGIGFNKKFNSINFSKIEIKIADEVTQYNDNLPISKTISTLYSLLGKKNYMKLYGRRFANVGYSRELFRGFTPKVNVSYAHRYPLSNTTEHSWFKKEELFQDNHPQIYDSENRLIRLEEHQALTYDLSFKYRPGQKYSRYPDRKWAHPNKWPVIVAGLSGGVNVLGSDVAFLNVTLKIDDDFNLGTVGKSFVSLKGGTFLNAKEVSIVDYFHFGGNQTFIYAPDKILNSFYNLPYYQYSTKDDFVEFHWNHDFKGYLTDRIPVFKKLGWTASTGLSVLKVDGRDPYIEWNVGLNNLGFGVFRLFRLNGVWSKGLDEKTRFSLRLGADL